MATLDEILALRDLATLDKTSHRLPTLTEATIPAAIGKGLPGGVAAVNSSGQVVDTAGNPVVASSVSTLTGATTVGKAVMGAATTGAALTALGAAAATDVTALNTTVSTVTAHAPYFFYAVGGVYGGRPVYPGPVVWASIDVAPPATTGTTTSGTTAVAGLDFMLH